MQRSADPQEESSTREISLGDGPIASELTSSVASEAWMEAESFRLMAEYSVDVLCRLTIEYGCTYCSPSSLSVFGWTPEEMRVLFPFELIHPEDVPIAMAAHTRHMAEEHCDNAPATLRYRKKDGNYIWVEINARLVRYPGTGAPWQVLLNMRDVSERKLLEQQLEALTLADGLTGLGNRRAFDKAMDREWRRAMRDACPLSLLLLDVDHFKSFNDNYGHQVGDDCLRTLSQTIASLAKRPGDMAVRYGGEELAVILPNTDAAGALRVAEEIRASIFALSLPHIGNRAHRSYVTASIGAATVMTRAGGSVSTAAGLLQSADSALYKAKHNGRNRVEAALLLTPPL